MEHLNSFHYLLRVFLLCLAMLLADCQLKRVHTRNKAQWVHTSLVREAVVPTSTEKFDCVQSSSLPGSLSPSVLGLSHSVTPRHRGREATDKMSNRQVKLLNYKYNVVYTIGQFLPHT